MLLSGDYQSRASSTSNDIINTLSWKRILMLWIFMALQMTMKSINKKRVKKGTEEAETRVQEFRSAPRIRNLAGRQILHCKALGLILVLVTSLFHLFLVAMILWGYGKESKEILRLMPQSTLLVTSELVNSSPLYWVCWLRMTYSLRSTPSSIS